VATAQRIHFAAHGFLNQERPELSGLALTRTDAPGDDGLLQVFEIFNLDLSAQLVVLSACETGGTVVAGEGLVGLARAFLYAGAPTVVVSLWRIRDDSAPKLMVQFYRALDQHGDAAAALREAKRALIAGGLAQPYYWAPFILVGESR
jgi:CHAT domain-containing protein